VLTEFTAWGETVGDQTKLLVLTPPSSGTLYNVVAKSEFATFTKVGLSTFPVQVRARAGQLIALFNNPCFREGTGNPNDVQSIYSGPDPPAGTDVEYVQSGVNERLTLAATLEPDCDGDGFGDETQDPDTSSCNPSKASRTVALDANKSKVKKAKRVLLNGQVTASARQGGCAAAQTVELLRKRPSQSAFSVFATVQTDAQGRFSVKKKLKKTTQFQARVLETASCGAALSNTDKVKVKKNPK
jgi:hypothetical protein